MEKMSKRSAFLTHVSNELYEVKCHISNERFFEGGVGLGGIINFINYELGESLKEIEDEEIQDEEWEEECEDGSEEEVMFEKAYEDKCKDYRDAMRIINDKISIIEGLKNIIKDLIKNDHIFPGKVDYVITNFSTNCPEESKDALYGLQAGRTIRMKE